MLEIEIETDRKIDVEIYFKELAHIIMEAEKSQDLQSASRMEPRRAEGTVPV